MVLALGFDREAASLEPVRPDFGDADDLPALVEDAEAALVGFDVLAFAFALALVGVAACLRSELALGVGAVGRESAEARPFADDDEGLVGAWDLEAPAAAAGGGLLLGRCHVGLRVGFRIGEMGMEQVVLERTEVTCQLLAGLGDGGAEGRR